MRSDVQAVTHILTIVYKYLFLGLVFVVCLIVVLLLLRERFAPKEVDRKEVSAKMLCTHTDVCVSNRFVKTCFYVTLVYDGLTVTVENSELYEAFEEVKEVAAYVVTYSNGMRRLEVRG